MEREPVKSTLVSVSKHDTPLLSVLPQEKIVNSVFELSNMKI